MNDEATTNEEVAALIEWLRTTLESGAGFAQEQAPLYVEELIRLQYAQAGFNTLIFSLFLALSAALGYTAYRALRSKWSDELTIAFLMTTTLSIIPTFLSGVGFLASAHDAIAAWIAPRVFIIEHVQGMV